MNVIQRATPEESLSDYGIKIEYLEIKMKGGFIYILTSKANKVFYTGVTSDLVGRIMEHNNEQYPYSFTAKYKCKKLIT